MSNDSEFCNDCGYENPCECSYKTEQDENRKEEYGSGLQ